MTFTAGALADITLSSRMFRLKNVLSMCSAPLECLISALYWGIRAVDPRLVVPAELASLSVKVVVVLEPGAPGDQRLPGQGAR